MKQLIRKVLKEQVEHNKWNESDNKLTRKYKFSDYNETLDFVNKVAKIAEKQNHHPDITFGYNTAKVSITDHEKGGVSDKCHKFVKAVDGIKKG
jgi:4a-hydroxytetrahydrobiopterin dehydratase